ncbi:MAG: ferritin-like domain-containing protein [Firmicutes bacterium]|jgi:bacterioferritin|nr:ferritin-like domain-containing protein [Bacillota bacterium]
MERKDIINKLNWFYFLENNQVQLYTAQSEQVDDIYIKKALQRVAEVEQGHVENIARKIRDLGGTPSMLGEKIAPLTGITAGHLTGKAGLIALLEANIKLEEKAMKDYKDFLLRVGQDEELFNILWDNLIDEDLHTAWFANKVAELKADKK